MHPNFHAPAVDRAAARYEAAICELARRTGRAFFAAWAPGDRALARAGKPRRFVAGKNVSEDEVVREHADLADALNVHRCAGGCGRASTLYHGGRQLCAACA